MSVERYCLDTNILIYSIDTQAGKRHEKASHLMREMMLGDCVLTLQSLGEFFHGIPGAVYLFHISSGLAFPGATFIRQASQNVSETLRRPVGGLLTHSLDEPTTWLYFHDVARLLDVLHALENRGNTVIVCQPPTMMLRVFVQSPGRAPHVHSSTS